MAQPIALVVEDNTPRRAEIERMLVAAGCAPVFASIGKSCMF
jgi:hypothetical protein